jgi:APA family basic amino acid/polyamine antiporter
MLGLDFMTWMRFVGWLAAGLVIYFMYGYKNSVLRGRAAAINPDRAV